MANVLILGGGFGGLVAAEQLSKSIGRKHRITLVSLNKKFTFYPALVRLAFGYCEPGDITFNLEKKLNKLNIRFVEGEVFRVDPNNKKVSVTGDDFTGNIAYDFLIVATGRRLASEKVRGFFDYSDHLLGVKGATRFGEKVKKFEKGKIVVGLSPQALLPVAAFETAFAVARKFQKEIENRNVSVDLVLPETVDEMFAGAKIHHELLNSFNKLGITETAPFTVAEVSKTDLISKQGQKIPYDLLMLLPPFRGQPFLKTLKSCDEFDFVKTDAQMRVPTLEGVYAVGDIVSLPGPKLAYVAIEQAIVATANIASEIKGEDATAFYYHEIAAIIDAGGPESLYLHYGIWDASLYKLKKGRIWNWTKRTHDRVWQMLHKG